MEYQRRLKRRPKSFHWFVQQSSQYLYFFLPVLYYGPEHLRWTCLKHRKMADGGDTTACCTYYKPEVCIHIKIRKLLWTGHAERVDRRRISSNLHKGEVEKKQLSGKPSNRWVDSVNNTYAVRFSELEDAVAESRRMETKGATSDCNALVERNP